MREIRILMVDDHSLFRESLSRLLEAHSRFHVVGECATVAEAIAAFSQTQTDVVLLDYDLGEESGFGLIAELKRRQSAAQVLMVTAGVSDEMTLHIMESGASGVFLKHGSSDQLATAIQQIADGEIWLDSTALHCLVAGRRNRQDFLQRTRPLTARQSEVLRGILDGLANKEIAWKMKTSESSVKAVIQELFHKAGVRTRSQLVRIAIEKHSSDWLKSEARR
jgi:two-component system, NarL family, nitrate/nitrite response regulator NarL